MARTETPVPAHEPVALVRDDEDVPHVAHVKAPPPLGLTLLDRLNALAFADGDRSALDELAALVRDSAAWLAGPDCDASRRRLISREVAAHKTAVDILQASIGERVKAGKPADLQAALTLDKLATGAVRRLAMLIEAHRREGAGDGRQPVVAVGVSVAQHVLMKKES